MAVRRVARWAGAPQWFPQHRVVAYYGAPGTGSLGVLGATSPEVAAEHVVSAAAPFGSPGKTVLPAFELIATVADGRPGPDDAYSHPVDVGTVWTYLQVARAHHLPLILDIQPGRADFLSRTQYWAPLLAQPDTELALDPEWRMDGTGIPGRSIGHTTPAEINAVTDWLSNLIDQQNLPQKLLVLHQFTGSMIVDPAGIVAHPELAMVQQLDGFGSRPNKITKYQTLQRPQQFHLGFKLFYTQDVDMMAPADVLALTPPPDYVSYQ